MSSNNALNMADSDEDNERNASVRGKGTRGRGSRGGKKKSLPSVSSLNAYMKTSSQRINKKKNVESIVIDDSD